MSTSSFFCKTKRQNKVFKLQLECTELKYKLVSSNFYNLITFQSNKYTDIQNLKAYLKRQILKFIFFFLWYYQEGIHKDCFCCPRWPKRGNVMMSCAKQSLQRLGISHRKSAQKYARNVLMCINYAVCDIFISDIWRKF